MTTFVLICWGGTFVFNLLSVYFVWKIVKLLKEVERLRKERTT